MLHYLLPDHLDVFKALHAADVVHQDVGVCIADASAAQIQPLLKDKHTQKETHKKIFSMTRRQFEGARGGSNVIPRVK